MDAGLRRALEEKIRDGARLTRQDGAALYASDDLAWLGGLAHEVRTGAHGDVAHFAVSGQLDLTRGLTPGRTAPAAAGVQSGTPGEADAIVASGADGGSARAGEDASARAGEAAPARVGEAAPVSVEEAVRLAEALRADHLTELHITFGAQPALPFSHGLRSLRAIRQALPGVALTAFGIAGIHHVETASGRPAGDLLDELVDAGVVALSGGGAGFGGGAGTGDTGDVRDNGDLVGLPVPETGQDLAGNVLTWKDYARIHRLAHERGLATPCTMRYGHGGDDSHQRVEHVLRLRGLQDETGGFPSFAPLCHQPGPGAGSGAGPGSGAGSGAAGRENRAAQGRRSARASTATGAQALKTFAVSRLLFDNVPHLTASWVTHGVQTAQLALQHGADAVDGPVAWHHAAGAGTPHLLARDDVLDLIRDAGLRPVQRDARYRIVRSYEGADPGRRDEPQPMRV